MMKTAPWDNDRIEKEVNAIATYHDDAGGEWLWRAVRVLSAGDVEILMQRLRDDYQQREIEFEDEIESIINEFGNDPAQALLCIGERIELARHYRAHPNAPRGEVA